MGLRGFILIGFSSIIISSPSFSMNNLVPEQQGYVKRTCILIENKIRQSKQLQQKRKTSQEHSRPSIIPEKKLPSSQRKSEPSSTKLQFKPLSPEEWREIYAEIFSKTIQAIPNDICVSIAPKGSLLPKILDIPLERKKHWGGEERDIRDFSVLLPLGTCMLDTRKLNEFTAAEIIESTYCKDLQDNIEKIYITTLSNRLKKLDSSKLKYIGRYSFTHPKGEKVWLQTCFSICEQVLLSYRGY